MVIIVHRYGLISNKTQRRPHDGDGPVRIGHGAFVVVRGAVRFVCFRFDFVVFVVVVVFVLTVVMNQQKKKERTDFQRRYPTIRLV